MLTKNQKEADEMDRRIYALSLRAEQNASDERLPKSLRAEWAEAALFLRKVRYPIRKMMDKQRAAETVGE